MPIDTRFLKSVKDKVTAASRSGLQFINENPRLSLGSGAAMLIAPAIFSNDQRGYLQTSTVTTPLIAAGSYSVPSIIGAFRSQFSAHSIPTISSVVDKHVASQKARAVSYADVAEATQKHSSGSVPYNVKQDVLKAYYAERMKKDTDSLSASLVSERTALMSHLKGKKILGKQLTQGELRYLSGAIHSTKLRTLSAAELSDYATQLSGTGATPLEVWQSGGGVKLPSTAPILTQAEIEPAIEAHLNNPEFVSGMKASLARMKNLVFPSGDPTFAMAGAELPLANPPVAWANEEIRNRFRAENPIEFGLLEDFSKKAGVNAGDISFGVTPLSGRIAEIRYKTAHIPIAKNGRVYSGDYFRNVGIERIPFTEQREYRSSAEYALEALLYHNATAEAVEKEIGRHHIYAGIDTNQDWSAVIGPNQEMRLPETAVRLRIGNRVPGGLFGFSQFNKESKEMESVGFDSLDAENIERVLTTVPSKHSYIAIGNDKGTTGAIFQAQELENLVPYPVNTEKQLGLYRAITKNTRLTKSPILPEGTVHAVRDRLTPFVETDYLAALTEGDARMVAVRAAGVTSGEQALFGNLPSAIENMRRAKGGALLTVKDALAGYADEAALAISRQSKLDKAAAKQAWMAFSTWLSEPANLRAMGKLQHLGEGAFLAPRGMYGLETETLMDVSLDSFMFGKNGQNWQSFIGQSVEEVTGAGPEQEVILGQLGGDSISTLKGHKTYIENVEQMGNGIQKVSLRQVRQFKTGAKGDLGGVKGTFITPEAEEVSLIKAGLNRFRAITGIGGYIPEEVSILKPFLTAQGKEDPYEASLNIVSDTFRRLDEYGELEKVQQHVAAFEAAGYKYDRSIGKLSTAGKDPNWKDTTQIIENMFDDISVRMKAYSASRIKNLGILASDFQGRLGDAPIRGDRFMRSFGRANESSYMEYAFKHADPGMLSVWDTTSQGVPSQIKVTQDLLSGLSSRGYHAMAAELQSRAFVDGDKVMTGKLQSYLQGNKSSITNIVKMEEGLGDGEFLRNMGSYEGRKNTFFDPGFEKAQENFLMELEPGVTVPVLGHRAFGGGTNRHGAGEFSGTPHEKSLMDLMRVYGRGNATDSEKAGAIASYTNSLKQTIFGKKSFYREGAIDKHMATGQFLVPRVSSLRYADGSINPFEVAIGADALERMAPEIQEAYHAGEDVFTALARYPISATPMYKLVVDPFLTGTNTIAYGEAARGMQAADYDKDTLNAFVVTRGRGKIANPAWEEAKEAALGEASEQRAALNFHRRLHGFGDDPGAYYKMSEKALSEYGTGLHEIPKVKSLLERLSGSRVPLEDALRSRSTARSIGAFSNTLTQMTLALEHNRNLTSTAKKNEMLDFFFEAVKQAPISATKGATSTMHLSKALAINKQLERSINPGGKYEDFRGALKELATAQDNALDRRDATGRRVNKYQDYLSSADEDLRAYHSGYPAEDILQAKRVLTTSAESAGKAETLGMAPDMLPYLQEAAGLGAEDSASALGAINRTIAKGAKRGRNIIKDVTAVLEHKKAGLVLGAGIAIAAAAGIATSSISSGGARPMFGRDSANSFRPEDHAGVSNATPGAAWEGSRAARPSRVLIPSRGSQTKTAIVAPIGEMADMDVRMKSPDRARAIESAKMLRRIATSGDSNVTINYRDPKRRSLRTRERMLAEQDED